MNHACTKFMYPKVFVHFNYDGEFVADCVCSFNSNKTFINKTLRKDLQRPSAPEEEEDILENPPSEEDIEDDVNVFDRLRLDPWTEEDPETLLLIEAALE